MRPGSPSALVGRAGECAAIDEALRVMTTRPGTIVTVEGEPGIGKTRLLDQLAARAAAEGATVLGARASEFERDLPYALWTEALDRHMDALGERGIARMGLADPAALGTVLPTLIGGAPAATDRHRTHRALRNLLEQLAAARPLVVWMDDLHWADLASLDAIAALVRRPPAAPVLFAITAREGQRPAVAALALAAAHREDRVVALNPGPLTESEATELIGEEAASIFPRAGGNPFYLEQLARVRDPPHTGSGAGNRGVPPAVAAALDAELTALAPEARRMLEAAAIAGDPFEVELAVAVADLAEPAALHAVDELLVRGLIRGTAAPRRFAFRHPVVRHAVYVATPPGWRLGAHGRAADELARRGAGHVQRAHHVEHAARSGDEAAITLLTAAAAELQSPAPAAAARFHAAALRLLPELPAQAERRSRLQRQLADAQAAAGDPAAARNTLLDALQTAAPAERLALTVALANQEWWLGGHEQARVRLQVALAALPALPSPDRVRLRLALALTALLGCDFEQALIQTSDAGADARAIADPVFELAALACAALASASAADELGAQKRLAQSVAALERLTPRQLATRLPAFWMHGRARRALGDPEAALADLRRGAALAEQTGRERVLLMVTVESVAALVDLGRLREAIAAAEEGLERARLSANPRMQVWAQSALASARLAAGDVAGALRDAEQAAELDTPAEFHAAGQPGWALGAALTAAGNAGRAVALLLDAFGGPELPQVLPADRPAAAADLIDAQLALGDVTAAEATLTHARTVTPAALTLTGVAHAEVLLAQAHPAAAIDAAAAAHAAAPTPMLTARAVLTHGRALAAAGDRRAAVQALTAAETAFADFGAMRRREQAVRELRRVGHRVTRPARSNDDGALTAREREIADLVATGRTNREIAVQLVLSTRTIEAHLRSIYAKLAVRSRVELAHALHRIPDRPS